MAVSREILHQNKRRRITQHSLATLKHKLVNSGSSVLQKRKAMTLIIEGMIRLKFPDIDRRRCAKICQVVEHELWKQSAHAARQVENRPEHEENDATVATLKVYCDTKTIQRRLRSIVKDLKASRVAKVGSVGFSNASQATTTSDKQQQALPPPAPLKQTV